MEIILSKAVDELTGKLTRDDAYFIVKRYDPDGTARFFTDRRAPYNRAYADDRHAQYILKIAGLVTRQRYVIIDDIRLTVREFVDARISASCGKPLKAKEMLRLWCNIITMRLRKVKPSSVLNARDVLGLADLLNPPV